MSLIHIFLPGRLIPNFFTNFDTLILPQSVCGILYLFPSLDIGQDHADLICNCYTEGDVELITCLHALNRT